MRMLTWGMSQHILLEWNSDEGIQRQKMKGCFSAQYRDSYCIPSTDPHVKWNSTSNQDGFVDCS